MSRIVVYASILSKIFYVNTIAVRALRDVSLEVHEGEFGALIGSSGAGKTTLLNIIGGLDKPTSGEILVFNRDIARADEDSLANFRCNNIGFVFQSYNLISTLTVGENIAFPMEWTRKSADYVEERLEKLLVMIHLRHRIDHFPSQLSGGEQQRVAFARALANDPPLLLVDEPTGNLDLKTSSRIVETLHQLKALKKTILVATHDDRIIELADIKLRLEGGKLVELNE